MPSTLLTSHSVFVLHAYELLMFRDMHITCVTALGFATFEPGRSLFTKRLCGCVDWGLNNGSCCVWEFWCRVLGITAGGCRLVMHQQYSHRHLSIHTAGQDLFPWQFTLRKHSQASHCSTGWGGQEAGKLLGLCENRPKKPTHGLPAGQALCRLRRVNERGQMRMLCCYTGSWCVAMCAVTVPSSALAAVYITNETSDLRLMCQLSVPECKAPKVHTLQSYTVTLWPDKTLNPT